MFFCYLIDMSLTFGAMNKRGVYRESDGDLASQLKVSPRTIHNWRNEIASTGEVWITHRRMKNTLPETVYNFTCLVGQAPLPLNAESEDGSQPHDDIFRSNRKRSSMIRQDSNGRFVCRVHGVAGCQACRSMRTPWGVRPMAPIPSKVEENQADRKFLPSAAVTNFRAERNEIAVDHGKSLPQPTEENFRGARKEISVDHGKSFPQGTENPYGGARKESADNTKTVDVSLSVLEESFKRSTVGNASKKAGGAKKITVENAFLADVAWIMDLWKPGHGKFELDNSGAWWRQCYRSDADLIARVLAETRCAVKEGRIKTTPGQYAVDLWKRWSLDLLKQKTAAKAAARA